MNTAIVFINAEVDQVPEVAEQLAAIPGVTEVYSVTGAIDLVAIVRTRTVDEIADIVTGRMNKVPGMVDTQTHLAFRAYSTHDLDAAFSLGD
ncbi:MAG: Lrp/AsnC ligand binding domain-containing protein [Propionibacteriaceae bacterium]|nr:Lrp/AsnC ligand binding domain-containing protein [Propionibacteriaceae bacterium]